MPRGINIYDEQRLQGLNSANANSSNIISPTIPTDGLILHLDAGNYISYPKTGTTWRDLSAVRYDGTLNNTPTASSSGGGAITFDGIDDFVSFPTPNLTLTDASMVVWLKRNGNQVNWASVLFDQLNAGVSVYAGITFRGDNPIGTNQLTWAWGAFRIGASQSDLVLADNTWYMAAFCASVYYSRFFLYSSSGVIIKEASYTLFSYTFTGLNIGKMSSYTDRDFKGDVGIALIYNRFLSDLDMNQIFNATRVRFGV